MLRGWRDSGRYGWKCMLVLDYGKYLELGCKVWIWMI